MSEEISYITTKEAADLSGYTPRHIQNLIKNGIMSASKDEKGNYVIQKCEFYRVFPKSLTKGNAKNIEEPLAKMVLESEIRHLREMLDEKNKQNNFLHGQLELAESEKSLILRTLTSNTKLLEHTAEKLNEKNKRKKWGIF